MVLLPFGEVGRPGCLPQAMTAIPHDVPTVDITEVEEVPEHTLGHLEDQLVVGRRVVEQAAAPSVAGDVVEIFGIEIQVDGRTVVFETADGNGLLAGPQRHLVAELVVEVDTVGGIEKFAVQRCLVQPLAQEVGKAVGQLSADDDVQVLSLEAARLVDDIAVKACVLEVGTRVDTEPFDDVPFLCHAKER